MYFWKTVVNMANCPTLVLQSCSKTSSRSMKLKIFAVSAKLCVSLLDKPLICRNRFAETYDSLGILRFICLFYYYLGGSCEAQIQWYIQIYK